MKFTIITSIYNQKDNLPQLIEALSHQIFTDFEVIFADDGSSDGTIDFLNSQELPFPFKTVRQKDKGMRLAKIINKAIKQASGEYCVFIMGDSFPEVTFLEVISEIAHPDYIMCGSRVHLAEGKAVDFDWRLKKVVIPEDTRVLINQPWAALTGNGLVIPTEAFKKYGGWSEKFRGYGGEDNELVARLFYKGYLCWSVPNALIYHHWHKNKEDGKTNTKLLNKMVKQYAQ